MKLSAAGLGFLKRRESCKLIAYLDSAGVWTIGYGTIRIDGHPVTKGMVITQDQADHYLAEECDEKLAALLLLLHGVPVTQNQLDALVSFAYNEGIGGLSSSTLLREIRNNRPIVLDYFTRWNKIKDPKTGKLVSCQGLTNRRIMEFDMYSTGVYA